MGFLCKISLHKCMIITKKCILALYCAVFWYASFYFLKMHAISHYQHMTGAHELMHGGFLGYHRPHPDGSLFDWLLTIPTFVVMNLALIGLCFNWVLAPISLAVHATVLGIIFAFQILSKLSAKDIAQNFVSKKMDIQFIAVGIFLLIFGFFQTVSIWLAYDLYKMKLKKNSIKKATQGDDVQIVYHKMVDDDVVVVL